MSPRAQIISGARPARIACATVAKLVGPARSVPSTRTQRSRPASPCARSCAQGKRTRSYHEHPGRDGQELSFSCRRNVQVRNPIGVNFPREACFYLRQQVVAPLPCQSEMIRSSAEVGGKCARRVSTAPCIAAVDRRFKVSAGGKLSRNWSKGQIPVFDWRTPHFRRKTEMDRLQTRDELSRPYGRVAENREMAAGYERFRSLLKSNLRSDPVPGLRRDDQVKLPLTQGPFLK